MAVSYINLVRRAQKQGYRVSLLFFWLRTPELAMQRVAERVQGGGHNIPIDVIVRRYQKGICNLFHLFIPLVDYWTIYDNSENPRKQIAFGGRGMSTKVLDEILLTKIRDYVK